MLVVVITGPPGSGKSTTATAVHDSLSDLGIPNALIEVDELERSYPALPRRRVLANLRALASSYRDEGTSLLFVTATLETDDDRDDVLDATGGSAWLVIRLEASAEALRNRIIAREPSGWSGLHDQLATAERLSAQMRDLRGIDLVLDTGDGTIAGTAVRVETLVRSTLR